MPLLPTTITTGSPWRTSVSASIRREAGRAVAEQHDDLLVGAREPRAASA